MVKELKLKARKFLGVIPTFAEVTEEKLVVGGGGGVGGGGALVVLPPLQSHVIILPLFSRSVFN